MVSLDQVGVLEELVRREVEDKLEAGRWSRQVLEAVCGNGA